MKKYLLGIFAIALAIGFSAFTTAKHVKKAKTTEYFYSVTWPGGVKTIASGQDPIIRDSEDDNSDLDCGGTTRDCTAAYSQAQTLPLVGATNVDNQFKVDAFQENLP